LVARAGESLHAILRGRISLTREGFKRFTGLLTAQVKRFMEIIGESTRCREAIETDGWYRVRTKGSHHQYKDPTKPGLVTIPGRPGDGLAVGNLNNILDYFVDAAHLSLLQDADKR
jgi:predicted RNA binding protein YcfA (HicA-like mRNA interferase family)